MGIIHQGESCYCKLDFGNLWCRSDLPHKQIRIEHFWLQSGVQVLQYLYCLKMFPPNREHSLCCLQPTVLRQFCRNYHAIPPNIQFSCGFSKWVVTLLKSCRIHILLDFTIPTGMYQGSLKISPQCKASTRKRLSRGITFVSTFHCNASTHIANTMCSVPRLKVKLTTQKTSCEVSRIKCWSVYQTLHRLRIAVVILYMIQLPEHRSDLFCLNTAQECTVNRTMILLP